MIDMSIYNRVKFPVGIQTFSELVTGNYLYIDKTEYVYRMAHSGGKYFFLSRPRRFGKSLLTSTFHSYFSGRRELFEGLAISRMETEWAEYPVLHFDMSMAKHVDKATLESMLRVQLARYEEVYGKGTEEAMLNDRLSGLILRAYYQTGRQVVVLIDEYDAPLLDVMHEDVELPVLRNVMRNFYSPLKACDPYLRFVFLTGITKFSQLSIFSELNNISNISMLKSYAAICGITEDEIRTQMHESVKALAGKLGTTFEGMMEKLKERYDGYHFTWPSPDIYNPFSLMNAFANEELNDYWFGSGTPTYLIEMLRKYGVLPSQIEGQQALAAEFDAPTERMESVIALLYQSGYVTIRHYDALSELYTLGIPNREIRTGLMRSLLPNYVGGNTLPGTTTVAKMSVSVRNGDMDSALRLLQEYLLTVPYCDNASSEGHYQQLLYVIFSFLGYYVDIEVRTPKGRVDMVLRTQTALYVIELKLNRSADAAMRQIDLRDYPSRFALCGLPVVRVGINFSSEEHTITDWRIEEA
ncbi:MAG: ATP-binding protein [Bacteroides sp.]|nr:ATP-binding protein [Bacteroides sp.]